MNVFRDPLARIFTVGCISLGALARTPFWYVGLAAVMYALWTLAAGIPFSKLARRLRSALLFLTLIVVVNSVTESGKVLFEAGDLYVTQEGLAKGGEQALRLCIVLWGALLLLSTGHIEELQDAAERWTVRRGSPLLAAGTIAVNYLPLLVESARRITLARRARGEEDRPRFPGGLASIASAAHPLIGAAMRNADALAEAMESRCYEPESPRTRFRNMPVAMRDAAIALTAAVVTAFALLPGK